MVTKKELEEKKPTAVEAIATLFESEAGAGFEGTTSDDYALPFLKILQKMSPEVDPDDGAYVEGAKPGLFYDTATGELLETLDFVPCYYRRAMVEWKPRESGGGFVAQHDPGYEAKFPRNERGRWETPEGNYLADTRYFFGLRLRSDGSATIGVLAFASTQIKKARGWLTRLQAMKFKRLDGSTASLPIFAHVWHLSTVAEENEQGAWRGYRVDLGELLADPKRIKEAHDAREMFVKSAANFAPPSGAAPSDVESPI